jgi:hypothetical protein
MVSPTYSSYSQLCVCRVCSSKLVRQSSVERRALQPTPQHCGSEVRCKVMTDSQTLTRTWAAPSSRRYAPSYAHSPHTPAAPHPSGVHAASCLLQRSTFLSALYLPRHPQTRITHTHSTVKHLRRPPGGSGAHLREGGPARAVSAQWDLGIYQSRDHDSCPRAGAQTEIARCRRQGRTHKMDGRMPREMRPWARTETSARHTKTDTGTETPGNQRQSLPLRCQGGQGTETPGETRAHTPWGRIQSRANSSLQKATTASAQASTWSIFSFACGLHCGRQPSHTHAHAQPPARTPSSAHRAVCQHKKEDTCTIHKRKTIHRITRTGRDTLPTCSRDVAPNTASRSSRFARP